MSDAETVIDVDLVGAGDADYAALHTHSHHLDLLPRQTPVFQSKEDVQRVINMTLAEVMDSPNPRLLMIIRGLHAAWSTEGSFDQAGVPSYFVA